MLIDKDAITALATITESRKKLMLYLIAKGVAAQVESSQLGQYPRHQSDHSPSGWTTTFTNYLHWLRSQYPDTGPIHLILDLYSVHRCEASGACAVELGIVVHSILVGWTNEFQLLDRYVLFCSSGR
jgi:hypothetical protein